jgi:hypothetical protein
VEVVLGKKDATAAFCEEGMPKAKLAYGGVKL